MTSSPAPTPAALERRLGPLDAAAIIVSNVIGAGILFTSPGVAATVPQPGWFLGTWIAGGALALIGASAYSELAARRSRAGGEYVYLHAAFGRVAAFLTGWTSFVAGFSGAIAASAIFLTFYMGRFAPVAANNVPLFVVPLPFVPLTFSPQTIISVAAIWLVSWVHVRGVGPGRAVSNVLATLKILALLFFIALGFSIGSGSTANFSASAGTTTPSAWLFALIPVMFAYSGWNAAAYMAEEVRDPGRNLPRALAIGTFAVIAVYLLLNLLYLFVFSIGELATLKGSVLDVVADRLIGARAGDVMGIVSIISLLASINGNIFAGPRVYYAMARDGMFLPAAARIHPRYRTPAASIVAQAVWSTLLVLSGGGQALINYTGFAVVLFAGIAVAALFVLRQREPDAPRPFSAFGYPWAPALFVLTCAAIILNALWTDLVQPIARGVDWGPSAYGLLIIALGLPVYLFFSRQGSPGRN